MNHLESFVVPAGIERGASSRGITLRHVRRVDTTTFRSNTSKKSFFVECCNVIRRHFRQYSGVAIAMDSLDAVASQKGRAFGQVLVKVWYRERPLENIISCVKKDAGRSVAVVGYINKQSL